ncbi:hypothetical protein BB407_05420 [Helicobacter pylori]|nr:hypothetical protein BB407_05420 [Helicobacter pylori]
MKPLIIVFSLSSVPKSVVLVYQSFKFVLHYKIKFLFGINILKLLLPIAILLLPIVLLYAYFNRKTSDWSLRLFEMTQRLIDKLLSIAPIKRQNATEKALCIVRLDVVGDYILTRNFFAPFKEIPILIENPQFWLQYAICHISIGKFKEAQDYLNQAYGKAKQKNRLYNVDYIDNQQARLYIYQGTNAEDKEDAFRFFKQAVGLLGEHRKEDEYKYSIIESFWEFLEKHFLHFGKNKQEVIQKVLADHYEKFCSFCGQGSWYKQKIIRGCEKVFEKYLPNPEKPNLSKNLSSK